jgi:undecaprenyl-diphosphatase
MAWWQALILGVLQGFTEFLPVSSSGHLALAQMVFDRIGTSFSQPGVVFDAMLHVGTALAVVWAERSEIRRWLTSSDGRRILMLLIVGTGATSIFAFPLRDLAKGAFTNHVAVGVALIITWVIVFSTKYLKGGTATEASTLARHAALIGLIQGLAIFPGISRSGTTIATGLGAGLDRAWAARFSFLLSVPAICGATLVELISERDALAAGGAAFWFTVFLGGIAAAITGYVALKLVIRMVSSRVFDRFAWYCIPLGIIVLLVF